MLDFHTLAEFSRANCISICAFLVPANLLTTILTMFLAAFRRPSHHLWLSAGIASIFALVMVMHVYSWFLVGVVMLPTYILLALAITCLLINSAAIIWLRLTPNLTVAINTTSK
ncbi:hypothetical protein H6G41_10170 [Tolypothrix sp. FACHB-123]|uniref:hypothetical protein n=1 Tax=Tolypothrix sp. FACHB-123 TaxID=2692868 RepID=UPI001683CE5A|nr:hypothetical protein [Tolypothrix sp. FACHB-123]MBD2354985.1 hypothetical protein [Tolypothrix sp. FACHB-123]